MKAQGFQKDLQSAPSALNTTWLQVCDQSSLEHAIDWGDGASSSNDCVYINCSRLVCDGINTLQLSFKAGYFSLSSGTGEVTMQYDYEVLRSAAERYGVTFHHDALDRLHVIQTPSDHQLHVGGEDHVVQISIGTFIVLCVALLVVGAGIHWFYTKM